MTPVKCAKHELRPGEYADSPRYTAALREARTCFRCRVFAAVAVFLYRLDDLVGTLLRSRWFCPHCGSEQAALIYRDAECIGCYGCLPKKEERL